MFNYTCRNCSLDIGYSFWARSCEIVRRRGTSELDDGITWALKGDSHVFGYDRVNTTGPTDTTQFVALSATQSNATIHTGTNFVSGVTVAAAIRNPSIDNPQVATGDSTGGAATNILDASPAGANQTNTSIQPKFITLADLELNAAFTRGISHKIFGHISYTWVDKPELIPYLGIGAEIEIGQNENCATKITPCNNCINCSLSQWGVWVKGGFSF